MSVLDGKYKFSLQKQDNIYGVRRYSLLFPPDKFPDPKKEGCPSFFAKISNSLYKEGGLLS